MSRFDEISIKDDDSVTITTQSLLKDLIFHQKMTNAYLSKILGEKLTEFDIEIEDR